MSATSKNGMAKMRSLIEQLGGRRFVMTIGCGIACTVLVACGKIDGPVFRDIVIATVAAYITGNTWQKNIEARVKADDTAPVG